MSKDLALEDAAWSRRRWCSGMAGLAAAACWPSTAWSRAEAMLAVEAPAGIDPAGFLVSEKYDGVRAIWDGRVLRFRSGRVVNAPRSFVARLPAQALDGELWLGRGSFEALSGLVRRDTPSEADWRAVRYMVFDLPGSAGGFAERASRLLMIVAQLGWPALAAVEQSTVASALALQARLDAVVRAGGEGLMLHRADALWHAGRSDALLKLKPLHDAEAQVVAHLPGRGKHAGKMGALRVRGADGIEFQIGTGFSDAQRADPPAVGATVTYTHRGVTTGGVPRFASFLRAHAGI